MIRRALVLALVVLCAPAAAAATTVADVRGLITRADGGDEAALAQLMAVTDIDGTPVDLGATLSGASGAALHARLVALQAGLDGRASGAGTDPLVAAREELADGKYDTEEAPQPFKRFFDSIGDWVQDRIDDLDDLLPGGVEVPWFLLGLAILLVAFGLGSRMGRRLQLDDEARSPAGAAARAGSAAELERRAEAAEREGRLDDALRLRFSAGLRRLDDAAVIELRPSLTTGEVRRALRSGEFDALALTFERVTYGEDAAVAGDVDEARSGWPRVLEEARR